MFFADLREEPEGPFKRLTGVRPAPFLDMCEALEEHGPSGGRVPKLCVPDRLLLTPLYWREYGTEAPIPEADITEAPIPEADITEAPIPEAHTAGTDGFSEPTVCRAIRAVEAALTRSGTLRLPGTKALGKKALGKSATAYPVVVRDAAECPVGRPQRSSAAPTAARRSARPSQPSR